MGPRRARGVSFFSPFWHCLPQKKSGRNLGSSRNLTVSDIIAGGLVHSAEIAAFCCPPGGESPNHRAACREMARHWQPPEKENRK